MHFEIYPNKANEWAWRLKADNGETIASGESYKNIADCRHAVDLVKSSADAPVRELHYT